MKISRIWRQGALKHIILSSLNIQVTYFCLILDSILDDSVDLSVPKPAPKPAVVDKVMYINYNDKLPLYLTFLY
jgi:hypothetical protein